MVTFDIESKGLFQVGWGRGGCRGGEGGRRSGSEVVAETATSGKRMWSHSPRKEASVSPPDSESQVKK